ncbi:sulfite exporter TauE/SafE family protein [Cognatiluteimonas weifangensis]|uniref:Sulfite exporter TauE/SafE family protein n=1 Tax=Cognatiluteimonas weifangensis TaxID=2303539 RepID=A0A372DP76_9GAMM|nr:sulfite exporter TauE/SafE family protein [Luteimonas weifangensis]RFP61142.1 sulfite exporter TauE/SafE family protein [Luteimonas weifangensis]
MPVDWLTLGAAWLTGVLGGVHCAAMCGGIATGFSAMAPRGGWWQALQPNLGRVLGYTLAGAIVGGIGHGLLDLARMQWLANALRAAVGLVLVVAALRLLGFGRQLGFRATPGAGLWQRLRPLQRRLLPADSAGKRIALGMLWGWMPCGLSTTVLAAAWLQADAGNGALTMAAFGLGTLPMMLPLTWSGARLGQRLQRGGWRAAAGLLVLAAGLLTLAAPWLMQVPALHGVLAALGCLPRQI